MQALGVCCCARSGCECGRIARCDIRDGWRLVRTQAAIAFFTGSAEKLSSGSRFCGAKSGVVMMYLSSHFAHPEAKAAKCLESLGLGGVG